jgi:hypothetical protein
MEATGFMRNLAEVAFLAFTVPWLAMAQAPRAANPSAILANNEAEPVPLTQSQRWHEYLYSFISPVSLVGSATSAGLGQWRDTPEEWGEGGKAYARRFISAYGQHVVTSSLLWAGSSLLNEDNRYIPSGRGTFGDRLKYALESPFLTRHDNRFSRRRVAVSRLLAFAGAAAISRLWQPESSGHIHNAGISFAASIGVTAGFDVASEFLHVNFK